ncbi:MAG: hypothetical protein JXE07_04985 [Candidatus Aminicenantes bacterium]|nr:hypothetical protein [Candidatus Aminicenantes bacterium]
MNYKKKMPVPSLSAVICLAFLSVALVNCKNPTGADEDREPYITVRNDCGIAVDVYMNSAFQFFLNNYEYSFIENITPGACLLEAKKKDTDILLKSFTVEIGGDTNYTWTISSVAQLSITNSYGETLDIYGDGTYQSDLADQGNLLLPNVPYGEHLVEAKKTGGTTVVSSITIDFIEDITYEWIIQK